MIMLEIKELKTDYGKKQILFGLSLEVRARETVGIRSIFPDNM